jgi:hypothetical protein
MEQGAGGKEQGEERGAEFHKSHNAWRMIQ